jgi:hypothetical protein
MCDRHMLREELSLNTLPIMLLNPATNCDRKFETVSKICRVRCEKGIKTKTNIMLITRL